MADLTVPGMAHAKVVRSPLPHARIVSIDASEARAMSGVVCILTRDEVRADPDVEEVYGFVYRDAPLVAMDKVRHQGDIVAVVVADDVATAEAAAELVDVDYEELPAVMNLLEALADGAQQVHEEFFPIAPELRPIEGTNVCHHATIGCGDVEQGFAEADFVYEDEFTAPPVQHCALDLHAVISRIEDGKITVWTNCQSPFPLGRELERIFKMPARVIIPTWAAGSAARAATASSASSPPPRSSPGVRCGTCSRREETFMTFIRPAYRNRMRTGVRKDGTIVARHNQFWVDVGGYAISGARSANNTLKVATGPYRIPNARVDCYAVYTNKPPSSPYRGLPTTQHTMSYEAQFDRIARDLGIDRLEIRRKNLVRDGDIHITGDYLRSAHSHECLEQATEAIGWDEPLPVDPDGKKLRGRGVSCTIKYTLTPAREMSENSAEVALGEDGIFEVRIGTVNIGQGSDTVMGADRGRRARRRPGVDTHRPQRHGPRTRRQLDDGEPVHVPHGPRGRRGHGQPEAADARSRLTALGA